MTITYRLTFEDYYGAWRIHTARDRKIRSFAFISLAVLFSATSIRTQNQRLGYVSLFVALTCVTAVPAMLWFKKLLIKSAYRKGAGTDAPKQFTVDISETGMQLADAQSIQEWSSFSKYAESDDAFILFHDKQIEAILPKRAFDSNAIGSFRKIVAAKVRPY